MKAVVVLLAAFAFASAAAFGQGQFVFNTRDLSASNNVMFCIDGPASGPDLFVEVLAGPDAQHISPLSPLLPLNQTGADIGYTNPFEQTYTVQGMTGGSVAIVAYRAFQGTNSATATAESALQIAYAELTEPPTRPNEASLGSQTVVIGWGSCIPTPTWGPFQYATNHNTVTITGYTGPGGEVTIPDTITGLPVTSIGEGAFFGSSRLTRITIPNSVKTIQMDAFRNCPRLTGVIIPNSVTNIGIWAFRDCLSLEAITVDALNPVYSSVEGVVFDNKQTGLILCPPGKSGSYRIPNQVTNIEGWAFWGCTNLTDVILPNSMTSIGGGAFYDCTKLTSVMIPSSVTGDLADTFDGCTSLTNVTIGNGVVSIGFGVFFSCTNLTSVTLPNSVTSIGSSAFSDCASLADVTIPDSVTSIGPEAFFRCASLTGVIIPDSVTSIGLWAFKECTNLTSVTIPNSVTNIGEGPFVGCTGLTAIAVDPLNTAYSSLDGVLFNRMHDILIQYPGGKTGSYVIPNSVTNIGTNAFSGCTGLTKVTIPNSVTSIGYDAFSGCSSLGSVTIPATVTTIGSGAFRIDTSLKEIYFEGNAPSLGDWVFGGSSPTVYYLLGTTGWGATFGDRPTSLWLPQVQTSDTNFGVQSNRFGFTITWASDKVVVVEAVTDLTNPTWFPVATNTLTGGSSYFNDPQWPKYPRRFYRVRAQ